MGDIMKYINKKQKIVLIIIISIITLGVAYYTYIMKTNDEFNVEEQSLEIENTTEENNEAKEEKSKIIVHVSGAVKNEGIVELEEKARVADAIEAAGGVTEDAYMRNINLASLLEDGMKVYIPTKEEVMQKEENSDYIIGSNNIIENNNVESKKSGKVNINTATKEELDTLPGVGELTANKIISYREENGKFKSIEEIKEVSGIGDSKFEQIKDLIEIWDKRGRGTFVSFSYFTVKNYIVISFPLDKKENR